MSDRPRIGITVSPQRGEKYYVPYLKAVEAAGAEPVELPPGTPALPEVDGLLLPGGWDVDPAFYGEAKDEKVGPIDRDLDETELKLFRQAREQDIPILGILFQHRRANDQRNELVIFITPRIVNRDIAMMK